MSAALESLGITPAAIASKRLCRYAEATSLEVAELGPDGREHRLTPPAADAWRRMQAAARTAGIELYIVSAFRSIERQTEIFRRKLAAGQCLEDILLVSAPPGYSEHHTGRAVDLATPGVAVLDPAFTSTPAFAWLEQHAAQFSFTLSFPAGNPYGYQFEPWHWCFRRAAAAAED